MADEKEKGYSVVDAESPAQEVEVVDSGALAILNKSEINQQIATAKEYPRSMKRFRTEALELATMNEKVAEECLYALPRGGKSIEGPSVRFAEILAYSFTNVRILDRCIGEEEKHVTSQGIAFDVERNVVRVREVQRRITNKYGKRYDDDMVNVTKNAASAVASRNATLALIPKALWVDIYQAAREAAVGTVETLANKRASMISHFQKFGVTADMIFATVGVAGVEEIGLDQLATLKGVAQALKEGDISVEEAFPVAEKKTGKGLDGLKEALGQKEPEKKPQGKKKASPEKEPEKKPEPEPEPEQKEDIFDEKEEGTLTSLGKVLQQIEGAKAPDQLDKAIQGNIAEIKNMTAGEKAQISDAYQVKFAALNA